MSQNGKQRANNEWSFTKYDVFDRPVLSGIITGGTYESHKAALDAATVFYEERDTTVHGYTNQSYPSVPNANSYLTVTYYDDYDWLLTMDENNARNLRRILPHDPDGKIRALLSFAGLQRGIADPWYTGDFGTTYDDLVLGCTAFLDALRRRGDI